VRTGISRTSSRRSGRRGHGVAAPVRSARSIQSHMPFPSDDDLRQALKYPLRRQLVPVFRTHQPLNPKEASRLLRKPLYTVAYHVKVLVKHQVLILHNIEQVRGVVAHYYIPNEEVLDLPIAKELLASEQPDCA
jgi:predicted transcriptional regulator